MAQLYKTPMSGHFFHAGNIAIVTVGLPARGKTYLAHKLCRYLRWTGIKTCIFSIGDYRRNIIGTSVSHDFFNSEDTKSIRLQVANLALDDLIKFINCDGGQVGIYDGSNTEPARRDYIYKKLSDANIQVLFIESVCDKEEVIWNNIREVKLTSPDYKGMDNEMAINDFIKRIDGYKRTYASISDENLSFIKDINIGDQLIVNKVCGYLPTRIVYYLMNLHIHPRRIFLCRNGESMNENYSRSDAPLSPRGAELSKSLAQLMSNIHVEKPTSFLKVWTSPRRRSEGTASKFKHLYKAGPFTIIQKPSLVEIHPGMVDGMTDEEISRRFPEDYQAYKSDPYNHRFPRGESYHDMALRLESVLLDLEKEKDDVLIIAHPTVLRCIYAYFIDIKERSIPSVDIPYDVLFELIPIAYGCKEKRYTISDELSQIT